MIAFASSGVRLVRALRGASAALEPPRDGTSTETFLAVRAPRGRVGLFTPSTVGEKGRPVDSQLSPLPTVLLSFVPMSSGHRHELLAKEGENMSLSMNAPASAAAPSETGAQGGWITEADAIRVALGGSTAARLKVGGRALFELIRDPDRTEQVFLLGIALNGPYVPQLFMRMSTAPGGAELMKERPTIDSKTVDFDHLRNLGSDTLGGAYARYLDDNHLDPDLFQAPPGLPPDLSFIAQRIRQTHDIWHVLTGYRPDVPGELALQGFTFAQLRMPSAFLIATLGTATKAPLEAARVLDGYKRGRDAAFLPVVRFEDHWTDSLDRLRAQLTIRPPA